MRASHRAAPPTRPITAAPFGVVVLTFAGLLFQVTLWLMSTPPWFPFRRAFELGWVPEYWAAPVAGHWRTGFEASAFTPCTLPGGAAVPLLGGPVIHAEGEAWWAELDSAAGVELRRRAGIATGPWPDTIVFVAWRGEVGAADAWGHLGAYRRAIAVRRVHRVRAPRPDDCARATPVLFAEE